METGRLLQWLDDVTEFLEQAITRLSILCLITGFVMGTVSILTPQFKLADLGWFNLTWAVVQAIALDTLFVGVLFLLRDSWGTLPLAKKIWYVAIAVLLGAVASMVNATLAYQEIQQIKNQQPITVLDAMHDLGIDIVVFSYIRSVLVVLVTSLVCTLPRKKIEHKRVSYREKLLRKYRRDNEKQEALYIAQSERIALDEQYAHCVQATQPVKWSLLGIFVMYDTSIQQNVRQIPQEAISQERFLQDTIVEETSTRVNEVAQIPEDLDTEKVIAVQMTSEEEELLFGKR